ncbi:MAG: nucleotidyltransferase domain-containing protein [Anaerolineae bacterium]|nr:nucleotidyltransferase domain-containing protein [Anaerolineae bacterium]
MMTPTTISHKEETALQAYADVLEDRFGPQLLDVLLFGSKARNEASTGSDVDVAVILLQPTPQDLSAARGLAFDIWLSYGVYLSIRAMSQQGWQRLGSLRSLFYRNVERDGISLLSRAA